MTLYQRIGRRIRQAREALGYSQEELGRLIGCSAAAISYFEAGLRKVKIEDLQKIARALGKPIDFFLQEEAGDEIITILGRAKQELSPKAYRQLEELIHELNQENGQGLVQVDLSGFRPYAAAYRLLESQGVKTPPVPVKEIAREIGIIVLERPFEDEVSAVLVRSKRFIVIAVNEAQVHERKRFSVAHELGHAVLGHADRLYVEFVAPELLPPQTPQRADDEREANWFASDLLMPAEWVRVDWKRLKGDLAKMAKRYEVSEQAMWIRLQHLNLVQLEFLT